MSGSLQTIYSWSLNLNSLLGVSLMRDLENKYQKFFVFLNLVPGIKKADGMRSYDFKGGGSINFKIRIEKLHEINTAISCFSRRQQGMIGPYSIINDSSKSGFGGGGIKTLYINYMNGEESADGSRTAPAILFNAKFGDKKVTVSAPIPAALAFGEICKKIFDRAIELDMAEFTPSSYEGRGKDFDGSSENSNRSNTGGSESFPTFSNDDVPF